MQHGPVLSLLDLAFWQASLKLMSLDLRWGNGPEPKVETLWAIHGVGKWLGDHQNKKFTLHFFPFLPRSYTKHGHMGMEVFPKDDLCDRAPDWAATSMQQTYI